MKQTNINIHVYIQKYIVVTFACLQQRDPIIRDPITALRGNTTQNVWAWGNVTAILGIQKFR